MGQPDGASENGRLNQYKPPRMYPFRDAVSVAGTADCHTLVYEGTMILCASGLCSPSAALHQHCDGGEENYLMKSVTFVGLLDLLYTCAFYNDQRQVTILA